MIKIKIDSLFIFIFLSLFVTGCLFSEKSGDSKIGEPIVDVDGSWPWEPNLYSWDGTPIKSENFPLKGLYDLIYFDGHKVEGTDSPLLPPGEWDYNQTSLLANWRGFSSAVGSFRLLKDSLGNEYGWKLNRATAEGVSVTAVMESFHGSSGADILDFGPEGSFASTGNPLYGKPVNMGDGPDVFRYTTGHSAAARLGSSKTGHLWDNDLALIGENKSKPAGTYEVVTTTIHTGPGNDLVFVNNWERAAIDLGNGQDGRTDATDPFDGRDIVVIGNNARDFRVFGGKGDDLFVWHLDEVNQEPNTWLGPNFFGGGGWGEALYSDSEKDRLVLNIPLSTRIVTQPGDSKAGTLLVFIQNNYATTIDTPTENDPSGRYYILAPEGEGGQRTMTLQYQSIDGLINTAYFYVTDVEELQIGVGGNAEVYALDDIAGTVTRDSSLSPVAEIPVRSQYEGWLDSY